MAVVSIIIPSYNQANFIREAVESALAQTHSDVEVIVVDDGSTDSTLQVLEPYLGRIEYLYQENRGPSGARNTGFYASRG